MELGVTVESALGYGRKSGWHWWDGGGGVWQFGNEVPLAMVV